PEEAAIVQQQRAEQQQQRAEQQQQRAEEAEALLARYRERFGDFSEE
ncbi:MAG: Uma2 family endonuclease, partial [Symploca sp. SIO1B1]|nr:Uma2 family endonuclease [Symploca sp. SIO1B1]